MKIKSLMYVLMGTMLVVACTDSNNEEGIVDNGGGDDSPQYVIPGRISAFRLLCATYQSRYSALH